MPIKYLSETAVKYMNDIWGFSYSSKVDELTAMWEQDEPECVAKMLHEAGAIEPNCKEAKQLISVAKSMSERVFRSKIRAALKKYTKVECTNCNYIHYIPDYVEVTDWTTNGSCDGCLREGFTKVIRAKGKIK